MAEMQIDSPLSKKIVEDYDIVFSNGAMIPITVDTQAGDTMETGDRHVIIHLVSKPSMNDPTKTLPAEDITLFVPHIVSIQHRKREVIEQTPEQQEQWRKVFQEMSGTVN